MAAESVRRDSVRGRFAGLDKLFLSALSEKQLLILNHVSDNSYRSITSLLLFISESYKIPLSTLKLNAKKIADMRLIETSNGIAAITELGSFVLESLQQEPAPECTAATEHFDKMR
jgi:predicted transcriptional regulator